MQWERSERMTADIRQHSTRTANLDVVVVIVPGHQMGSGAARLACADHAALQHRHGLACDASQNCQ